MVTRTNHFHFILAGVTAMLVSTLAFAEGPDTDQAQRILQRSLRPSTVPYEGVMTVTRWYGPHTKSEEVHVRFRPPRSYRREFLKPDGSVVRVVVSDGENEQIELVRQNKTLVGGAAKHVPKQMPDEQEWELLRKNYRLALAGEEHIAGRPVWVLTLTPAVDGKLIQTLWVDQETGVILENKRSRPHGNFVVQSRYQRFHPVASIDPRLFIVDAKSAENHEFAPDFLTREQLKKDTGRTTALPASLPFGFEFESADTFIVDGRAVDHLRYTDGLSVLSVFETSAPVRSSHEPGWSEDGAIWHGKVRGRHCTAMGDVSREMLQEIFAPLK